jgi:hypothetical protein
MKIFSQNEGYLLEKNEEWNTLHPNDRSMMYSLTRVNCFLSIFKCVCS